MRQISTGMVFIAYIFRDRNIDVRDGILCYRQVTMSSGESLLGSLDQALRMVGLIVGADVRLGARDCKGWSAFCQAQTIRGILQRLLLQLCSLSLCASLGELQITLRSLLFQGASEHRCDAAVVGWAPTMSSIAFRRAMIFSSDDRTSSSNRVFCLSHSANLNTTSLSLDKEVRRLSLVA